MPSVDIPKAFQLVEQGASTEIMTPRRKTLLYYACETGDLETVTSLINCGANLNLQDSVFGFSPLMCASVSNHLDIVKALLEAGANQALVCSDGNTAFSIACIERSLEIVKVLYEAGSDINAQNKVFNTPLITTACIGGAAIDITKLLLDSGADFEIKNKYGKTALDCAIYYKHESIVDFLEEVVRKAELKTSSSRENSISTVFSQRR